MDKQLRPVFVPSLSAVLIFAEDQKGSPLDLDEVIDIRDNATVIMMSAEDAEQMEKSRGYHDIDPENCWYDWQILRKELGRKPDLEPGVKIKQIDSQNQKVQESIQKARSSVKTFRELIKEFGFIFTPMIKFTLEDNGHKTHMWLLVGNVKETSFEASLFEVPSNFTSYHVGDKFEIEESQILDWMINKDGDVYGGFSLRYHRELLNEIEKEEFDRHVGIVRFC